MRISDWSSDVCSSDLSTLAIGSLTSLNACGAVTGGVVTGLPSNSLCSRLRIWVLVGTLASSAMATAVRRSEEHTSELQSLMRISYAVFCLKKNKILIEQLYTTSTHKQIVYQPRYITYTKQT